MTSSRQHGRSEILLVEEEASERQAIARHLEASGFAVLEADDSDKALAFLEGRSGLRGNVTDAHVPGRVDRFELAGQVWRRWPAVAVVMMSGHSYAVSGPVPDGGAFVAEPSILSHLVPALNRLIDRAG